MAICFEKWTTIITVFRIYTKVLFTMWIIFIKLVNVILAHSKTVQYNIISSEKRCFV